MNDLTSLTQAKLIQRLFRDEDIEYIAFVTSSWHFLSAQSTIAWLKKKKHIKKGIILVCEHPTDGQIIEEKMLFRKWFPDQETYMFRFTTLASDNEVRQYVIGHPNIGKPFYIMRPVMPKLEFSAHLCDRGARKNIVHIVLEEGMASYMRDWKGWIFEEKKNQDLFTLWKQFSYRTWKKYIYAEMLKRRNEYIENTLFVTVKGKLVPNRRAISYLKGTIESLKDTYDFSRYKSYDGSVIICTQTYSDQNLISGNADIQVVKECCRRANKMGYHVIIKPHPREKNLRKYEGLGAEIDICNAVPLEAILAQTEPKPRCVIGITTTTLVSAHLFWKIPALSIARLIKREAYSKEIIGDIDNYCNTFSSFVKIPTSTENIFF